MRHLLLTALLVGTTFGQDRTPPVTDKPIGPPIPLPAIPQTPAEASQLDPNAPQICVEVRFVSGSPEAMQQMQAGDLIRTAPPAQEPELPGMSDAQLRAGKGIQLVSASRVVEEREPVFVRRLNDKQAFQLLKTGQADERVSMLMAPKVTMFDGQKADIKDTVQRPFVVGLKKDRTDLKPIIRVVEEGVSLNLRAATKPDGVRLDLAINMSQIMDVKTKSAGPENTVVQVPRVSASKVSLSALVQDGDTLAIGGLRRTVEVRKTKRVLGMFKNSSVGRETENMIILITPRIILPENQAGKVKLSDLVSQNDWCATPAVHEALARRQRR